MFPLSEDQEHEGNMNEGIYHHNEYQGYEEENKQYNEHIE
jgi:hypothetical protein